MESLVSTAWLAGELAAPDLSIVDATLFLGGGDAQADYIARHIPGARFLDLDAVADPARPGDKMLPDAAEFATAMTAIGVGSDDRIVVYDNSPLRSAARGWFMFRHYGARHVSVLDGGFSKWLAEGRPTESGPPPARRSAFRAVARPADIVVKCEIATLQVPLVDARGAARFAGLESDPRPGVADGHIPGARNLPYASLWNEDGTMRDEAAIRTAFAAAGVDPAAPFVASCGSGITANSLIFAAHRLGNDTTRLYDGSWSEWGTDPATPKEVGPARD